MARENVFESFLTNKKVLLWRAGWVGLSKMKLFHIYIFIDFTPSPKPPLIDEWQCWFESCFNYNCPRIWRGRTFDWCTTERHFQWILSTAEWLSRLQRVQKILAKLERVWANQKDNKSQSKNNRNGFDQSESSWSFAVPVWMHLCMISLLLNLVWSNRRELWGQPW